MKTIHLRTEDGYACGVQKGWSSVFVSSTTSVERTTCRNCLRTHAASNLDENGQPQSEEKW